MSAEDLRSTDVQQVATDFPINPSLAPSQQPTGLQVEELFRAEPAHPPKPQDSATLWAELDRLFSLPNSQDNTHESRSPIPS